MSISKEKKIKSFNVNDLATNSGNMYGLPFSEAESDTIIIPVPWEVTVSYSKGTANGPKAIATASMQVDLFDKSFPDAWKKGIFMVKIPSQLKKLNIQLRHQAEEYLDLLLAGQSVDTNKKMQNKLAAINQGCQKMNLWVKENCLKWLNQGKQVVLLGGDHSTPLGMIEALAEKHTHFGILQIDAHADLRKAYEGFDYSHASIMYNALNVKAVSKLVQVGIRDFCLEEFQLIQDSKGKIKTFFDKELKENAYSGLNWKAQCEQIIQELPDNIYLSIDIDGLDPKLCPNTGTPVPGGLEFEQLIYLVEHIIAKGKKIIAFDLVEVAPGKDDWDANVGARLLYRLNALIANQVSK